MSNEVGDSDDANQIIIDATLRIPRSELVYRATRSGGPGGQHVNTSSTRVELFWDLANSPSVTVAQRSHLLERLAHRLDSAGVLRLAASGSRSQARNKEEVTDRFRSILAVALQVPKPRKRTRPTRASKEARLRAKRRRSEIKRRRGPVTESED